MDSAATSMRNLRALALVGGAGAIAWIMNFATFALMAHRLGARSFGLLSFGLSVAAILGAFIGPNLNVWGSRVIARDHDAAARTTLMVNGVQLLAGTVLFGALALIYPLVLPGPMAAMLTVCNVMFLATALGTQWVVQGLRRLDLLALNQFVAAAVALSLVFWLIAGPDDAKRAPLLLAAGQVFGSAIIVAGLWNSHARWPTGVDWRSELRRLAGAAVFVGFSVCGVINQNAGLILTQVFGGEHVSALYGVGARTYLTFFAATAMLSTIFFPRVAARAGIDEAASHAEIRTWLMLALSIGGGPAALMIGAPRLVIHQLFGDAYLGAAFTIRAAGAAIFISFATNAYTMSRLARGGERDFLRAILATMVVAVGGGAAAAALFGLNGVAAILPCMELTMLFTILPAFRRDVGQTFGRVWIRPVLAVLATITFLLLPMLGAAPLVKLGAACVLYGLMVAPWREAREILMARRGLAST